MRDLCPMSILDQAYSFLQMKILPHILRKHHQQFSFGFEALTLMPFTSLNGNARMVGDNRNTAESKMRRVVGNEKLLSYFPAFVQNLQLVKPRDRINVDFSTFCGFQVLTFAKQTALGRAVPVYIAAITYPIENPGSQTQFIIKEVEQFAKLVNIPVHFVFDRGFELPYLANCLVDHKINFTIRMRKDKHILYQMKDIPLRNLPWFENDVQVDIYGKVLRVVRSEKKKHMAEPWYLLTNDFNSTKDKIIADYYFRFEIEETFKDLKHIFALNKFYTIKKKQTFLILLWFFILSIWLAFLVPEALSFLTQRVQQHMHKRLSIVRHFFEQLQREKYFCMKLHLTTPGG